MSEIRHDDDGFLLPKEQKKDIAQILENTEELLARQSRPVQNAKRPKSSSRPVQVSIKSPKKTSKSPSIRATPAQKRAEKDRLMAFRQSKIQTELLESIAKNSQAKKGGIFGKLMPLLGLAGGLLKGGAKMPMNLLRGMLGGGKAAQNALKRDKMGRFYPKGASESKRRGGIFGRFSGSLKDHDKHHSGGIGRWGKLARGMAKGGLLGAMFGLFDGLRIENSNLTRPEKNKEHVKNLAIGAGGVGGAMVGAAIGSVVPVVGTVVGAILGGFGGAALMETWVEWLDDTIPPEFSNRLFGSWQGFTSTIKEWWGGLTMRAGSDFGGFVQTAKDGWTLFANNLNSWASFVWNDLMPKSVTSYFENLANLAQSSWSSITSFGQNAWNAIAENGANFWNGLNNVAQKAFNYGKEVAQNTAEAIKNSPVGQFVGNVANQAINYGKEVAQNAKNSIASTLGYDMTQKYDNLGYKMGAKNLNGSIDCSGWSFQVTKMEMESLNSMLGFEKYKIKGNQAGIFNLGNHNAATQIGLASQYGVVTDTRTGFDKGKLQAGMMIGQMKHGIGYKGNYANIKGYGKTQYNHIVKVVRGADGKLYISESQGGGGNKGVTLTNVDKWLDMRIKRGDTLTAVNPFGDDIGLLNGGLGAIAKNEVSKITNKVVGKLPFSNKNLGNQQIIVDEAMKAGVSPDIALAMAHIETGGSFDEKIKNPTSSASGLFQFMEKWRGAYGLDGNTVFDARLNSRAGMKMLNENRRAFKKRYGREPTAGEIYLMHQQGATGAFRLLDNKNTSAVSLLGAEKVKKNGGNLNMTAGQFADIWINKGNQLQAAYAKSPILAGKVPSVPSIATPAAPKKAVVPTPVKVKPITPQQGGGGLGAMIGSQIAHKPVSRTVNHGAIAHVASGGIFGRD